MPELWAQKDDPVFSPNERQSFLANFHWRLFHILTFLVIPFVAAPLGITNKRTAKSTGLVVGLSALILVNELSEVAEDAVVAGGSPYTSLWLLYGLFALLGARLFYIRAFGVGVEPLQWIDAIWSRVSRYLKDRFGEKVPE